MLIRPVSPRRLALSALEFTTIQLRPRSLVYVGPARSANLGDRVVYDAVGSLLKPHNLAPLQTPAAARLVRFAHQRGLPGSPVGIVLGGGTLVGSAHFFRWLQPLTDLDLPITTIGVGVHEPLKCGDAADRSLVQWLPVLRRMEPVAVRGPRSARVLARFGIDADVVGDPVLHVDCPDRHGIACRGVLGLNLGVGGSLLPTDLELLGDFAADLCRAARRDLRIRYFSVWPPDEPFLRSVRDALGDVSEIVRLRSARQAMREFQRCDVVVAQKLHAAVLAVRAGVPTLSLGYHSKCSDFFESIGRPEYCLNLADLDGHAATDLLRNLVTDRSTHVEAQDAATARLAGRLRRRAHAIVAQWNGVA